MKVAEQDFLEKFLFSRYSKKFPKWAENSCCQNSPYFLAANDVTNVAKCRSKPYILKNSDSWKNRFNNSW